MPFRNVLAAAVVLGITSLSSAASCVIGDVDDNNLVDGIDLGILLSQWKTDGSADLNADDTVNGIDLGILLANWGVPLFETGVFPADWISGAPSCNPQPQPLIQVHRYNENTWILRQSKCTNFEGPFMFLLFGSDKVLMQDTGASFAGLPLAATVNTIINQWLAEHKQASIQRIITHSHSHGDHIAHDSQFIGQPNTVVVGTSLAAVQNFFGIPAAQWPTMITQYNLGGRIIDVIPVPGHHTTSIALYDRQTRILLTGDTFYPGFLFISNFSQYRTSIQRLVDFTAVNPVCWILGTHVEMSAVPGVAYPYGTVYQPNERVPQLTRDLLVELNQALTAMAANPHSETHDDFIITP